jgi:hypothetical protein
LTLPNSRAEKPFNNADYRESAKVGKSENLISIPVRVTSIYIRKACCRAALRIFILSGFAVGVCLVFIFCSA